MCWKEICCLFFLPSAKLCCGWAGLNIFGRQIPWLRKATPWVEQCLSRCGRNLKSALDRSPWFPWFECATRISVEKNHHCWLNARGHFIWYGVVEPKHSSFFSKINIFLGNSGIVPYLIYFYAGSNFRFIFWLWVCVTKKKTLEKHSFKFSAIFW